MLTNHVSNFRTCILLDNNICHKRYSNHFLGTVHVWIYFDVQSITLNVFNTFSEKYSILVNYFKCSYAENEYKHHLTLYKIFWSYPRISLVNFLISMKISRIEECLSRSCTKKPPISHIKLGREFTSQQWAKPKLNFFHIVFYAFIWSCATYWTTQLVYFDLMYHPHYKLSIRIDLFERLVTFRLQALRKNNWGPL